MSISPIPTLTGVAKNIIEARWREAIIGLLSILLAGTMCWVAADLVKARDKINKIPEPSTIVTVDIADQRFKGQDTKIESLTKDTSARLDRIENKLDTLIISMATRRRSSEDPSRSMLVPQAETKGSPNIATPVLASK
jgi:hypothetical protein